MSTQWLRYASRFVAGGSVVGAVSMAAGSAPTWAGLLAGFPSVFITALILSRWLVGRQAAAEFASGSFLGIWGALGTAIVTWIGVDAGLRLWTVILLGLATYLAWLGGVMRYRAGRARPSAVLGEA